MIISGAEPILPGATHGGAAGQLRRAQALARQLGGRDLDAVVVSRAAAAAVVGLGLFACKERRAKKGFIHSFYPVWSLPQRD